MTASLRLGVIAVAMVVIGVGFVITYSTVSAGHDMPHNENASGIPYWPGAAQLSKNYTYYVSEHITAVSEWNAATSPKTYFIVTTNPAQMKQYMLYSGAQSDIDLGNYFSVQSCKDLSPIGSEAYSVAAFMYGHHNSNNDRLFTVICLNVSPLGNYPHPFDHPYEQNDDTRRRGIEHEMGHSIHLDHRSSGIMNMNWLNEIDSHDVSAVLGIYSSPP